MEKTVDRTAYLGVRLRPHERAAIERAAAAEGVRISEWLRDVLTAAARRRLSKSGD